MTEDAEVEAPPSGRVEWWEQRTEWLLALLAVGFLVAYAVPILDRGLSGSARTSFQVADLIIWVAFVVDYVVRLVLARRWRYFWTHLHDLAMVTLPVLRPLRLLRLLMLLRVLNRRAANSLRGRVVLYVGATALLLIVCAALAVLDAERGHRGANISSFGDALWWSVATVCTVGYGDRFPTTTEGRAVATALMLGGIALIGVVTATFASWLIDRVREVAQDEQAVTRADLARLHAEVAKIRTSASSSALLDLAELFRQGLLSQEEFAAAKARLLESP